MYIDLQLQERGLTTDQVAQADQYVETAPKHLGRGVGIPPQQQSLNALHRDLHMPPTIYLKKLALAQAHKS